MTARQPRRRRRAISAAPLPRPSAVETLEGEAGAGPKAPLAATSARRGPRRPQLREHHVTTDYGYVHRDLLLVAVIGLLTIAFIVGMSFVIG